MRRDTARRSSRRAATPLENAPTPTVVDELASLDKTLGSFLAFVPVYGLFRIQQSEAHSADEKFRLSTLSLGATLLLLVGLLMLLPSAAEQHSQMQSRIDREIRVLYDVAEQYRAQHGRYPELPIWQRLARRADPRFYDPWGRPYRYEADDVKGVAIGTLGRDGIAKGRQDDSDLWLHFSPLGGSTSSSPEG